MAQRQELSIYVHIPFCVKKCNYCDFLSFPGSSGYDEAAESYVAALRKELKSYASGAEQTVITGIDGGSHPVSFDPDWYHVESVYIGGGTPSVLDPRHICRVMDDITGLMHVDSDAEITIECNPGTADSDKFRAYKSCGINRLSLGLQSTHDRLLKILGRIHTYDEFLTQYDAARSAGFTDINVDLMSALPTETYEEYCEDLERITSLSPEHISSYSLILEEGTPFYNDKKIRSELPEEELDLKMYHETSKMLRTCGYERYEISNYSRPGMESRHNSGYWTGRAYAGLGLGASSYIFHESSDGNSDHNISTSYLRYKNTDRMSDYISDPVHHVKQEVYELSLKDRIEEYMFLGLRMTKGVSISEFRRRFGKPMQEVYGKVTDEYVRRGLLTVNGDRLMLTDSGVDISDSIFVDLML